MDREYDYVTFLIKHKELFTFDKQQDNSIDEINNDEPDICDEY